MSRQWAMDENDLNLLASRMKPGMRVLEAGSGRSTVVMGKAGANVLSLEHESSYWRLTKIWLKEEGVGENVRVRKADIVPIETIGGRFPWYNAKIEGEFDFILVDGPPMRIGRWAAGLMLLPKMVPGGELWLDDAHRPHEQECLELWRQHFPIKVERIGVRMVRVVLE